MRSNGANSQSGEKKEVSTSLISPQQWDVRIKKEKKYKAEKLREHLTVLAWQKASAFKK